MNAECGGCCEVVVSNEKMSSALKEIVGMRLDMRNVMTLLNDVRRVASEALDIDYEEC